MSNDYCFHTNATRPPVNERVPNVRREKKQEMIWKSEANRVTSVTVYFKFVCSVCVAPPSPLQKELVYNVAVLV